ncbi:MAG: sigma-70 family RNA polymerase sigma factor [Verrucomicrobia bacterium]|nr:sigma-70 family RNA polymerase sigma factor [Verrucomicrobiota bacterium]
MSEVTRILDSLALGNPQAAEALLPLVYEELRKLAAVKMAQEAPGQTLQATALVHEAWLKLAGSQHLKFQSRTHFMVAAAEAMRRILIDKARRKRSQKRDQGGPRMELDESQIPQDSASDELIAVHESLDRLAQDDASAADLVKLRYFVGMTMPEAAVALAIPLRTAERLWAYARAWLRREIRSLR